MRYALVWLLALLLAACGDSESPSPDQSAEQPDSPAGIPAPRITPPDVVAARPLSEKLHIDHTGGVETPGFSSGIIREPAAVPAALVDDRPQLAIVIDDVGHSYVQGRRIIDLPVPVALAILPQTHSAARLAKEAHAQGQAVMLHLPMENGAGLPIGPGGLYSGMPREELRASLNDSLGRFAPIQGVNNHMGSRLTAERAPMDWVMAELQQRGLFFIDSRTTAQTQAAFAADAAGVRNLSRDVFLDNQREPEAIHRAFQRGLALARKNGSALLIGHPYPQTLDYLERWLPGLADREGVQVVSVQALLERKYAPANIGD
ncbi:divergent polysaccharide deacetylase family protein [Halopseudomonas pelagia]|uniref:divergent polysaccharide deacetylase family protein n=1 Tax=Halopseudomonas pelagia TaxID=553151 RepID=UPI00039B8191|nr:divergent polysaccharide deacetylase family protein [Halopseudomonas pelagia]